MTRPNELVLLRHGESTWNLENRFSGWTDVGLTATGEDEAISAGLLMAGEGLGFDIVHTSLLRRAINTANLALDRMDLHWLPVSRSWRLNERHYGGLQGLNKKETAALHVQEELYNLSNDPLETTNVLESEPDAALKQRARLEGFLEQQLPAHLDDRVWTYEYPRRVHAKTSPIMKKIVSG